MLIEYPLNQNAEIEYARKWAHLRNPAYYNFDKSGGGFYHSLLVVYVNNGMPYVATHTRDAFHIPLSSYVYDRIRGIHVIGARKWG